MDVLYVCILCISPFYESALGICPRADLVLIRPKPRVLSLLSDQSPVSTIRPKPRVLSLLEVQPNLESELDGQSWVPLLVGVDGELRFSCVVWDDFGLLSDPKHRSRQGS